ncbi:MAG TPA: hypothetical protein DD381_06235 [Lentisphaeria bacterium]|nr:MAG: hypothetical protein A2X47_05180 [Lentisphaerae bacterium GWF2_38_69]HBM15925.1 hypothetical protein [Lentisphaeria bacterium]
MIEKMLKVTVVCTKENQDSTLKDLRGLGILHVEPVQKLSNTELSSALQKELEKVNRSLFVLVEDHSREETHAYRDIHPQHLTDKLITAVTENEALKKEIEGLTREKEKLEPWGDFSFESIDKLHKAGVNVYLCMGSEKIIPLYSDKGTIEIVSKIKGSVYFALLSKEQFTKDELPLAALPAQKMNLSDINFKIAELNVSILANKEIIHDLTESIANIKDYKTYLEEKLEFAINNETMGEEQTLRYIRGFVPKKHEQRLSEEAKKRGWAILFETPTADDKTPTSIHVPKIFNISKPIFEFIGLYPGYMEWDVSGCFLIFFGIFFAMIIGDAGYATIFLIVSLVLKYVLRRNKRAQLSINLFIYLSILTVIWGILTCSFFSIPAEYLPRRMRGIPFFTDDASANQHFELVCFLLAAIHLSFARLWKAFIMINSPRALGQVGWALILWGNFFTAKHLIVSPEIPFPQIGFYLYGVGILLVFIFFVHWKEPVALFETPLALIGSFIDVLSYIRLFAVGIASVYIAENFNNMGVQIIESSEWLLPFGVIIFLAGHLLNIALGLMAVLVHGIRLNALEFSNHMELKWAGSKYSPFRKKLYHLKKKKIQ